ncbi:MAG TPA: glycosyltransferase [Pirellulales bacterium]|nr:glycosyltransferase [Pirellulales bacterium]
MPRFFLADPTLTSVAGHMWGYLRSLVRPVEQLGFQPVLLGSWRAEAALREKYGVAPVFECWFDARYGAHQETFRYHRQSIRSDLRIVSRAYDIDNRDVLLINTLRQWSLAGVVDWLEALPEARRPLVVLVLHFTAFSYPERASDILEFYQQGFDRIERSPARSRILLMADTQELVDEFQQINDRLTYVLAPIPHTQLRLPAAAAQRPVNLGYVGGVRENKGFHLLPHLVRRVTASEHAANMHFHVHSYAWDPWIFYRKTLAQLVHPHVTLYPEPLDDSEYERLMARLDVLVFPYLRQDYHAQTSGPFSEAMGQGKIVVAPRGTWLAKQIGKYGGGAVFNPGDAVDLANQVLAVLSARDTYVAQGPERAKRWCEFHNPEHFLRLVMDHAAGASLAA